MKITRYIHVVQRKDRTLLTFRRGFESSLGYRHTALVVKLADTSDLGSEGSGFESLLGHKDKCMTYVIDSPDVSTVHKIR